MKKANLKKYIYLLWKLKDVDRAAARDLLIHEKAWDLITAGAEELVMYIADPESDMRSPAPKMYPGDPASAMVCVWHKSSVNCAAIEKILTAAGFRIAGYLVDESVYREYGGNRHSRPRDWKDGERSPGVTAITLMERPARLSREEWIRRWHTVMSPVSESIQPRTRYVRNLVIQALTPDAPPFEGIVAEGWPSKKHVSNPFLFYGARNPFQLIRNIARILRAVTSFLQLRKIRTTMMGEYFIKTG